MIIASKPQVGKTSVSMSIMNIFRKRFGKDNVGFMKPVGQRVVDAGCGTLIDPDAHLARVYFNIKDEAKHSSPLVIVKGLTKAFVENKIDVTSEIQRIKSSFEIVSSGKDITIVEGTGHAGVGSILGINNAIIAKELGIPVVLVGTGGLGSTYDELALNKQFYDNYKVPVLGIIVNKVKISKLPMVKHYMTLGARQLEVPLLGCIPHTAGFDSPSCSDLEILFGQNMLSKRDAAQKRFKNYELVTTSLERFMELLNGKRNVRLEGTCFITHSSRVDLIMGLITHINSKVTSNNYESGLILSGINDATLPKVAEDCIKHCKFPVLASKTTTAETMRLIANYTAKMDPKDPELVSSLMAQIEPHIYVDAMLKEAQKRSSEM